MSKWTYEEFYKHVIDLQTRLKVVENKLLEMECATMQHRKAISDASDAMEKALTQGPVPWTNRESEVWEAYFSEKERERMEAFKRAWKTNPLNNVNHLPH